MNSLDMDYFEELKKRIDARLKELTTGAEQRQLEYDWLYGALGAVPSDGHVHLRKSESCRYERCKCSYN